MFTANKCRLIYYMKQGVIMTIKMVSHAIKTKMGLVSKETRPMG
ncbi:hypothetical protein CLV51_1021210 [Chitinophaga niastensis]|uniref:Uncharacterized protein n=1 Tax=Chitinophaga niastensis TaxID=536980 RepID=A0A2P8HQ28_CHINA|nr:hypothetical protein CLV51_1021210 [Chitinophaga niastensis]